HAQVRSIGRQAPICELFHSADARSCHAGARTRRRTQGLGKFRLPESGRRFGLPLTEPGQERVMDYAHRFPCHRCGGFNDLHHQVSSTPEVEARANEVADLVEPLCRSRGRMLGVMQADGRWIVCLSGGASVRWPFIRLIRDYDSSIAAIAQDWAIVPK